MIHYFQKEEKIFSLNKAFRFVPREDINTLWEEMICLLFVAGLYFEGTHGSFRKRGDDRVFRDSKISDPEFFLGCGEYHDLLGRKISSALHIRFMALHNHRNLNSLEKTILLAIDGLFSEADKTYNKLSGKQLFNIAVSRGFSADGMTIAHYVAMMYGQSSYPTPKELPRPYMTVFGNIHLYKDITIKVSEPALPYGSALKDGNVVTPLWAFMSAQIDELSEKEYPGVGLCERLSELVLLHQHMNYNGYVGVPRLIVSSSCIGTIKEPWEVSSPDVVADFYSSFLYGCTGNIDIIRHAIFCRILDDMTKKVGESERYLLFPQNSPYLKLIFESRISYSRAKPSDRVLENALEALDSGIVKDDPIDESEQKGKKDKSSEDEESTPTEEESGDEDVTSSNDSESEETDTSPDDANNEPTMDDSASPSGETEKDTIELISFDKTGEGIDADLYRSAVLSLCTKLKDDEAVPISQDTKTALSYWVNGYLYRAAIAETKSQIKALGLQKYLKLFN